jgi:hypothetical protein
MKLAEILNSYKIETLEQLSANKIPDIDNIRLPREVLAEELSSHLQKYHHVQKSISLRNPPSYLILSKILESPGYRAPVKGFKESVRKETEALVSRATKGDGLRARKDYSLYLSILQCAWESDDTIDASEARLLARLREELEISFTEHVVLEHHETLQTYWYRENYYERERNHLISSGIIFPYESDFLIPDELGALIRKVWGYALSREQYERLLGYASGADLEDSLKKGELAYYGSLQEKAARLIDNHVSPRRALRAMGIDSLREIARKIGAPISGTKEEIIENLVDFMDDDEDLRVKEEREQKLAPPVPESKTLSKESFAELFATLTNEQLYSVASGLRQVRKSGTKDRKVENLWDSPYSEVTLLNRLSNAELYELCARRHQKVAGSKQEKIERLVNGTSVSAPANESEELEASPSELIAESTRGDRNQAESAAEKRTGDLKSEYPFLESDELIILSYILETKTLSGPQLDRLIARFDLPWYYPDARMGELIEKLQKNDKDIVTRRSIGDYPMYELKS